MLEREAAAKFSSDISHKMCSDLAAAEFDSSFSEISRVQCGGRPPGPGQDTPYVDIYNEKPVRVATKVVVPIKQHPKVINTDKCEDVVSGDNNKVNQPRTSHK